MRLYYHPISTCSRRALMTIRHLGIDLELVVVDLAKNAQHAPEFLALNPNHRVPVLDHDGFVLWESYAIMQYLADLTPGQTLYPQERKARADVDRWLFWCGQDFAPGISLLNWEHSIKKLIGIGPADPAEVARGEGMVATAAKVLDAQLAGREWVCGSSLTLADYALAAPLADEQRAQLPIADLPNLQRWLRQVRALDAWKRCEVPGWDVPAPEAAAA
jgi:glutathione S-transferase